MFWLERTPIWVIGLLILVALLTAQQIGYAARRMTAGRKGEPEHSNDGTGYVLSAALALLGLLIAFTFGAAAERFDARRHLVLEEANAFGRTYLLDQSLDDAPRAALSRLMVQYVKVREGFYTAGEDPARLQAVADSTDDLQNRIWAETVAAVRAHPEATINPSLLQTTNDMFDLVASRQAALDARVPITILRTLMIYAVITTGLMGYGLAQGTRQFTVSAALCVTLSLAICLILDIDRPRGGTIRVSQTPIARALALMESREAAKSAAPQVKSEP